MAKTARINAIKSINRYTVPEAAETVGVTDRTIRTWIKQGLPAMTSERPHLIRGDDLKAFIRDRRKSRKPRSAPHLFHCFRCKAPRKAAGGFAECQVSDHGVNLQAFCAVCECVVNKRVAKGRLSLLNGKLELLFPKAGVGADPPTYDDETERNLHLHR